MVLRVIAACLDPASTALIRVMTPHPDTVGLDMTILQALKKMHAGHYLHLPVLDDYRCPIGLANVLQLTWSTLEQIQSMEHSDPPALIPSPSVSPNLTTFQQLWSAPFASPSMDNEDERVSYHDDAEDDRESALSHPCSVAMSSDSRHQNQATASVTSSAGKYTAKVKGPHGAVLISFKEGLLSYDQLVQDLRARFSVDEMASLRVCYRDDEEDFVLILCTEDLETAFEANTAKNNRLVLHVFVGGVALEEWDDRGSSGLRVKTRDVPVTGTLPSPDMAEIKMCSSPIAPVYEKQFVATVRTEDEKWPLMLAVSVLGGCLVAVTVTGILMMAMRK
jgi:hypothetical protein